MKRWIYLAVSLLLIAPLVFAVDSKTFEWDAPTEREDGTVLPDVEIAEFRIYCDGVASPIWVQTNEPNDSDTWLSPEGTFALGTHSCYATAVDTGGRESVPSNAVPFSVDLSNPKAPIFALR